LVGVLAGHRRRVGHHGRDQGEVRQRDRQGNRGRVDGQPAGVEDVQRRRVHAVQRDHGPPSEAGAAALPPDDAGISIAPADDDGLLGARLAAELGTAAAPAAETETVISPPALVPKVTARLIVAVACRSPWPAAETTASILRMAEALTTPRPARVTEGRSTDSGEFMTPAAASSAPDPCVARTAAR